MNKKLLIESATNLKKAVPLMMKYQVPTTPLNYALWYSYVANEIPELNKKLDFLIADRKVCPPVQAESLYRKFVADKTESVTWELREGIEKMLIQLEHSITDTHSDTTKFQQEVDKTFATINKADEEAWSVDEVAKSQKQALYDSLTGLLNRHAFDQELSLFLNKENQGLCLIMADLDYFKKFNDQWGHLLGDQVLKAVGRKLFDCMRNGATAYRFGGEEFVILLPQSNLRIARQFAESLRKTIEKIRLKDKRTTEMIDKITASFGVAEFTEGDSITSLITRADQFLYEAKRLGRNRVLPI